MTIEDLIIYGKSKIHVCEAKMLLANLLNYDTLELLNHLDEVIEETKIAQYKELITAFMNGKPLQYIMGNISFCGYDFDINNNVLIPRFETEELVENTLSYINQMFPDGAKVIDLGCGSGVIGITLKKKNPNLKVTCLDISDGALEVCKNNALKLGTDISIIKGDMLDNITEKFDVIVSNPPYIATDEIIEDIVKNNEPHIALYAGIDGLDCYRKILKKIKNVISDKYLIAFEIGYTQKEAISSLITQSLNDVTIVAKKDLSGKDRMIFVMKETL